MANEPNYEAAIRKALLESRVPDTAWGRLRMMVNKKKGKMKKDDIVKEWFATENLSPFQSQLADIMFNRGVLPGDRKNLLNMSNKYDLFGE